MMRRGIRAIGHGNCDLMNGKRECVTTGAEYVMYSKNTLMGASHVMRFMQGVHARAPLLQLHYEEGTGKSFDVRWPAQKSDHQIQEARKLWLWVGPSQGAA